MNTLSQPEKGEEGDFNLNSSNKKLLFLSKSGIRSPFLWVRQFIKTILARFTAGNGMSYKRV